MNRAEAEQLVQEAIAPLRSDMLRMFDALVEIRDLTPSEVASDPLRPTRVARQTIEWIAREWQER